MLAAVDAVVGINLAGRTVGRTALAETGTTRADGRLARLLGTWARIEVLVLDDFALQPPTDAQAADLLEVTEDRAGVRSTIVTSQLPVALWHEGLGEPTVADAPLPLRGLSGSRPAGPDW